MSKHLDAAIEAIDNGLLDNPTQHTTPQHSIGAWMDELQVGDTIDYSRTPPLIIRRSNGERSPILERVAAGYWTRAQRQMRERMRRHIGYGEPLDG